MNIKKAYNLWAKEYDSIENKTRDLDLKSTIETLSKYDFNIVLELGCGTGKNTEWLLKKSTQIIGLDFSEEMLNKAKEKITNDKVNFRKADINQDWEIENESVDLITSSLTLEHIKNLNHIFYQANQKLIQNGIFFISEYHPFKQYQGKKARFETEDGLLEIGAYIHHISDYTSNAEKNGFDLIEIKEWFDENEVKDIPRLISFVFRKK